MADDDAGHGTSPPLPTGALLHEPKFPYPESGASSSKTSSIRRDTPGKTLINDFAQNGISAAAMADRSSVMPVSRTGSDPASTPRPSMHKAATERPQPSARRSLLGRKRAGTADRDKVPRLNRRITLSFDAFDSDSTSSDSDSDAERAPSTDAGAGDSTGKKARGGRQQPRSVGKPFSRFKMANEHFDTKGRVSKQDGRLKLSINETVNSGYFAKTLGAGLKKHFKGQGEVDDDTGRRKIAPEDDCMEDPARRVRLNVVIIVIGSRGDIQPFLRIGKILKEDYGHRVRIATHPAFKDFVQKDSGLEFFSIGGDPSELMAFMVKNPGLIPSLDTVKEGEIGRRRAAMATMFDGMWRACVNSTDDEMDQANLKLRELLLNEVEHF